MARHKLVRPNPPRERLQLQGLNPGYNYRLPDTGEIFGGDFLHEAGLLIPSPSGDFQSALWELKAP